LLTDIAFELSAINPKIVSIAQLPTMSLSAIDAEDMPQSTMTTKDDGKEHTNGASYAFTVVATNKVGTSPSSTTSNTINHNYPWYAGTQAGNVVISTDGGISWTQTMPPDGSPVNSVFASDTTVYAGTQAGNVEMSLDGGSSWTASTRPDDSAVNSLFINGSTLYVGTQNGNVEISTDGGISWIATLI